MTFLSPLTLTGNLVTLEPLTALHHDDLVAASRDGELWNLWYTSVPRPEEMRAEIDRRLRLQTEQSMLPFTVRRSATGVICGMTTFMAVDAVNRRVEIGSTWTAAGVHRTGINTESKLLLLTHAFEALGCIAVEFRTHWMNRQSRAAIAGLGAKQDGVLRNHSQSADGALRDTVVFSVIQSEWPTVKKDLRHKLEQGVRRRTDANPAPSV